MQCEHPRGAELSACALVGLGGIGEAVAEHNGATVERGTDDLCDGLGAVGEHQAQFGAWIECGTARVQEKAADAIAQPCAPGLARGDNVFVATDEPFVKLAQLCRLARAIEPFECEEEASRHGRSVASRAYEVPELLHWRA